MVAERRNLLKRLVDVQYLFRFLNPTCDVDFISCIMPKSTTAQEFVAADSESEEFLYFKFGSCGVLRSELLAVEISAMDF